MKRILWHNCLSLCMNVLLFFFVCECFALKAESVCQLEEELRLHRCFSWASTKMQQGSSAGRSRSHRPAWCNQPSPSLFAPCLVRLTHNREWITCPMLTHCINAWPWGGYIYTVRIHKNLLNELIVFVGGATEWSVWDAQVKMTCRGWNATHSISFYRGKWCIQTVNDSLWKWLKGGKIAPG